MSRVTHAHMSSHTHRWVVAHTSMGQTRANAWLATWFKGLRVMSHTSMSHVTHINESRRTYQWFISHSSMSHVTHISKIRVTRIKSVCHDSSAFGAARCERYESLICATWLIDVCDMTHWRVWHDARCRRCVIWHVTKSCHIPLSHFTHESFHISTSHVTCEWVMSHVNESCCVDV